MTKECFQGLMADLYAYYGKTNMKDKTAHNTYFQALAFLPDQERGFLYQGILRNFKYFPALPEVLEIANMRRPAPKKAENDRRCFYCMDTGVIQYVRKGFSPFPETAYTFWASCPKCGVGQRLADAPYPPMDRLFGPEALEAERARNLARYGHIPPETLAQSKETVRRYLGGALKSA